MMTTCRASGARRLILVMIISQLTLGASGVSASDPASGSPPPVKPAVKPGPETNLICTTCDPDPDPEPTPRPTPRPTPTPPPSFTTLMNRYTPYDINGDGTREINSLKALFPNPEPYHSSTNGVVIVLVDPRLVTDDPNIQMSRLEMSLWLSILGSDISSDGFFPYFIEASVYSGPQHQDGWTLLALRRFLKDVRTYYPLAGVLLVGSFPDAAIVRSVFVKANAYPTSPESFTSGSTPVTGYSGHFLALDSEFITPRAEIVLGDLDGNWEALYRPYFSFTNYHALPFEPTGSYPQSGQVLVTTQYQATSVSYPDVFYIEDHQVTPTVLSGGRLRLFIWSLNEPSPEASAADQTRPNRIARPEILVSRIDPRRVAVVPIAPVDLDGKSLLDANGRPQELRYNYQANVTWQRDGTLERRLIADYIARSRRFRYGYDDNLPFRTSAIRALNSGLVSPSTFNGYLRRSSSSFEPSTAVDNATLLDYVHWLQEPAVLRGIAAHSDGVNSQFGAVDLPWDLEIAAGGFDFWTGSHVWRWVGHWVGSNWMLTPSFEGLTVDANFHIYRTLWQTGALAYAGQSFFVHEGCEVMRPKNAETLPYDDPNYGQANWYGAVANGESLMFYANGLGLMARNKVFNDIPLGFYDAIRSSGGRFGYGWRNYFMVEAENSGLDERALDPTVVNPGENDRRWRTLQRKRSYFWNTIGDFTLKIHY